MSETTPEGSPADEEAWNAALSYLSFRIRSRRELERHLGRRGYDRALVERVLTRCEQLALVDDLAFATAFVRDRIRLRPRGVARLEAELRSRGVRAEDAKAGIRSAFEEEGVTERDLLAAAARKRWRRLAASSPAAARRRLYEHLVRSGFPREDVQRAVAELTEEEEDA